MEILLTTLIVGFLALTTGYGFGWLDGFKTGCRITNRTDDGSEPPK